MRIVLETNVLVSGLLFPEGAPGEITRMAAAGALIVCFDDRILAEYREALARPRFRFDPGEVSRLLAQIESDGEVVFPSILPDRLPDRRDEPFLEVAVAAGTDFLVTGDLRHFPARLRHGVVVVSPRVFLETFRRP